MDRPYKARDTDNAQQVEQVGPDHVTQGDISLTAQRSHNSCGEFGHRGSDRHQRQPDDRVAHTVGARDHGRIIHQQPRPEGQTHQPKHKEYRNTPARHIGIGPFGLFQVRGGSVFTFAAMLFAVAVHVVQHIGQGPQQHETRPEIENATIRQPDEQHRSGNHHVERLARATL